MRPLTGFRGKGAALVRKDGFRTMVSWKGGDTLPVSSRPQRLSIQFEGVRPVDAQLHAVDLGELAE